MNRDEWVDHVIQACRKRDVAIEGLAERLCEKTEQQRLNDSMQRAMRLPKGKLTAEQKRLVEQLVAPVAAHVFGKAERGETFGLVEKACRKYGPKIDPVLKKGSEEHKRFARTFMTFFSELESMPKAYHGLILYHVLKNVEIMIRGIFLPSGDRRGATCQQRERQMRHLLEAYTPEVNAEAIFKRSPVFSEKRPLLGCAGTSAMLVTVILLTLTAILF